MGTEIIIAVVVTIVALLTAFVLVYWIHEWSEVKKGINKVGEIEAKKVGLFQHFASDAYSEEPDPSEEAE